jgi:hypothetical protein
MPVLRNPKHEKFAIRFAETGNATESYKYAGYNAKNGGAAVQACRLIKRPNVQARISELHAETTKYALRPSIRDKVTRLGVLADIGERMLRVVQARAADPDTAKAPGGDTGLLVRQLQGLGAGENFQVVEKHEVDAVLLREIREFSKELATQLGEREEKSTVTINAGVVQRLADARKRLGAGYEADGE